MTVKEEMEAIAVSGGLWNAEDLDASMTEWMHAQEIDHLNSLKTFRIATALQSMNHKAKLNIMFEFMGNVVDAATRDTDQVCLRNVFCFAAKKGCHYTGSNYECDVICWSVLEFRVHY